jgi:2,3-bisphosphoglycerate-dependent phosphoglycerate mutase|tara:strand:- start:2051 stop:2536 length:486 start_codon:yes stop_codon:yes gene_type:complete
VKIILTLFLTLSYIPSEQCSTFYLIRHAEKVRTDKSDKDPKLNEYGMLRAIKWQEYFSEKNISKIYSTNYKRTLETVKPIQESSDIIPIIYSPSDIDYKNFIMSNKIEVVLIVGHSNTIPDFVNGLIGENVYSQIDDLNNSNLYVVNICESGISHKLLKID